MSTRLKTHTEVDGARWPSVASRDQRLRWVVAILEQEGIDCSLYGAPVVNGIAIAVGLLKDAAQSQLNDKSVRLLCYSAQIEAEDALEAAVLD